MNDCIFCKIASGEIPSYKIYENDKVLAFLDISCDVVGHTLVIAKTHCNDVTTASKEQLDAVIEAVSLVSKHFVNDCGFDGVNVFNNCGESAGQSVMHMHFHVIPRKNGDGLGLWDLGGKKPMELNEIADKLAIKN